MTNTPPNISNAARETVKDARDAVKESGEAASAASDDIQADLQALRDDVSRLAQQIADIFAAKGTAAWNRARSSVDGAGHEAVDAVREVGDNMLDALDESLKSRPYATLALAAAIGFLFGATWRR